MTLGAFELRVIGEADTTDGKITHTAVGPGLITPVRGDRQKPFTAPWLGIALPMAVSKPPAIELSTPKASTRIAQGVEFRSHSDTEVFVHGYENWGEKLFEKLRGMFAFAIWNQDQEQLVKCLHCL